IYVVAGAIALGDGLGNFRHSAPDWIALALTIAAICAYLFARPRLGYTLAIIALVAAATIPVRDLLAPNVAPNSIRSFADGQKITLEGTVDREPERLPGLTHLYIAVNRAAAAGAALSASSGRVRIAVLDSARFRIGDEIRINGRLRFPRNEGDPGEFDYEGFLARAGIAATITAPGHSYGTAAFSIVGYRMPLVAGAIENLRERIGAFFDANLQNPERAEMRAIVIGDRGGITEDLRERFARTGMAHLLVISGLHLSFVAAAIFALVRLLMMLAPGLASRGWANKVAAIAAGAAVCAYAAIAGHHVSTVRALVMVLAYMFAIVIDRSREALASLAFAAIVICVAIPGSTADVGFQLSFASVITIIVGMQRFAAWLTWRRYRGRLPREAPARGWTIAAGVLGYVAVSFWAMLGTAPLTAYQFNQFAIVGLFANAIVVPIMGFFATLCGLAAALLSFIWMPPARAILWIGGDALELSNYLAGWFLSWPAAWTRVFTPTMLELALAYGALLLWLGAPMKRDPRIARGPESRIADSIEPRNPARFGWRSAVAAVLVVIVAGDAGWWLRDRYFSPDLRVTFLAVGEGDGAVVRFPGGRVMLIDAGGAFRGYNYGERVVAPYLWSRKIMHVDYLVLSHPDLDHFGGFAYIADNFSPGAFWSSGATSTDSSFAAMMTALASDRVPLKIIADSPALAAIGGVKVSAIIPESQRDTHNNNSLVLRLALGRSSFLFTGDIEAPGEAALIASGKDLRAAVLKVPHHGSATSSTRAFIGAVRPIVAVISDGYRNRFHFPAAAVIDRYEATGATVVRTDRDGAIIVDATARSMNVRAYRAFPSSATGPKMNLIGDAGH
ncbi:MAG: DNA internalization-related competence protein ComEC/Rec2, partial [Candidatus Binataceae bacterium]